MYVQRTMIRKDGSTYESAFWQDTIAQEWSDEQQAIASWLKANQTTVLIRLSNDNINE